MDDKTFEALKRILGLVDFYLDELKERKADVGVYDRKNDYRVVCKWLDKEQKKHTA